MTASERYQVPARVAEVARLLAEHPMADAVVDQVDGRMIRVDGHWLADFASCNYLGLDLDPEVLAGVPVIWPVGGVIPAGRAASPARPCTSRSRPSWSSCWASRTRSPSPP